MESSYKSVFTKQGVRSLAVGCLLLFLALVFQYYSSSYSVRNSQRFVGDIFLDNLPAVDLNPLIVEGALLAILFSLILLIRRPRYLIFAVKAAAILIALRAFFVAATHLRIYPSQVGPDSGFIDVIYARLGLEAGYFFSAHTALPFLMVLIFRDEKFWRYLYLLISVVFGASVLLAHVHYSIDVFAAPFMAYSVYELTKYLFPRDYNLMIHKEYSPARSTSPPGKTVTHL